jgi:DNA-directed RNA polymerase subunit RPC12/RpoP
MAIYRCKSCGAIMDSDAFTAGLGYGAGVKASFVELKCGKCGSRNIKEEFEEEADISKKRGFNESHAFVGLCWLVGLVLILIGTTAGLHHSGRRTSFLFSFFLLQLTPVALGLSVIILSILRKVRTSRFAKCSVWIALGGAQVLPAIFIAGSSEGPGRMLLLVAGIGCIYCLRRGYLIVTQERPELG